MGRTSSMVSKRRRRVHSVFLHGGASSRRGPVRVGRIWRTPYTAGRKHEGIGRAQREGLMILAETRYAVAEAARELHRTGLVQGTAGNVSARDDDTGLIAITPSAAPYESMRADDIAVVHQDGTLVEGLYAPSSEVPMHVAVYQKLPWVRSVVHTHSPYATTFAALNLPIEPAHYLIALVGERIPVALYATYGTEEIGRRAVDALGDGLAVLLQGHGVLTVGATLPQAMTAAAVTEYVARIYHQALVIGQPELLPREELLRLRDRFASYRVVPLTPGTDT